MGCGSSSAVHPKADAAHHATTSALLQKKDPHLYDRLRALVHEEINKKTSAAQARLASGEEGAQQPATVPAVDACDTTESLTGYEFPFENLVFEGGGSKGFVYCGALKCLEEAGVKAKRFAGSSAGAIVAVLLAVRVPLKNIKEYMALDFSEILQDHSHGILSLFPNLMRHFGWNPGQRFLDFFGDILRRHTGDADITFEKAYKKYGTELCIVAINANQQMVEYFHVKTTPQMPIKTAIRMSMSIPVHVRVTDLGFFAAVPWKNADGITDYYVDGGLLCNYPVHAFDGWWLSLKPEDSFYRRLRPLDAVPKLMDKQERFGAYNKKTLGFVVYSTNEHEVHQMELQKRIVDVVVPPPDTRLFRKKQEKFSKAVSPTIAHLALTRAVDKFFEALRSSDLRNDSSESVSSREFKAVFEKLEKNTGQAGDVFTKADAVLLFGKHYDVDKIFHSLDVNNNGSIDVAELSRLLDCSISMNQRFAGHDRRDIKSLPQFGLALLESLEAHAAAAYLTGKDLDRTVGLHTDYVESLDFGLEEADVKFLEKQGYAITRAYLLDYATKHDLSKK